MHPIHTWAVVMPKEALLAPLKGLKMIEAGEAHHQEEEEEGLEEDRVKSEGGERVWEVLVLAWEGEERRVGGVG
jgi:hypothetical protein